MLKPILYKEWIKTRWYFLLAILVSIGFTGYSLLRVNRVIGLKGMEHLWQVMLERDVIFIDLQMYIPLIIGILLAIVQFVPEIQQSRLKLTLHLPYPHYRIIAVMLLYGILVLLVCFVFNFIFMSVYFIGILAGELVKHILMTALTWYIAGFTGYLLTAWICLEPTWKRRILNIVIAVCVLRVFFLSAVPEAYNSFLSVLIGYTSLTVLLSMLSVYRFKTGQQD